MKILHTADWHLNSRLDVIARNDDLRHSLEQIYAYLEQYQVDVMVVAGDIIEKTSTVEQFRQALKLMRDIFKPFLARSGTILVITGNHDDDRLCDAVRYALDMAGPDKTEPGGTSPTGRLYLCAYPELLRLADVQGQIVQFALMPYPEPDIYLVGDDAKNAATPAKRHALLHARFNDVLHYLQSQVELQPQYPAVLVSHIHVRGIQTNSLYKLNPDDDVLFEPGEIPDHWTYIAYGHIHRAQCAKQGADHIRYSGSIARMKADETESKQVILVDISVSGERIVTELPLHCGPVYHIEITDPDTEIPALSANHPDAQEAIISYTLHYEAGQHNPEELRAAIESVFPRIYRRSLIEETAIKVKLREFPSDSLRDVSGNVRKYLRQTLNDDPNGNDLLDLAEELLAEETL